MPSKKPRLATYTTQEIIEKFTIIANEENRSISKQLEYIVKQYIENYEKQNGSITINNVNNNINSNIHINNK